MNERKRALRAELVKVRARLSADERAARSLAIADRISELPAYAGTRILALYAPLGTEVDTAELALRAEARGATLVYPRSLRGDRRLSFAKAHVSALVVGPVGALEPPHDAEDVALDAVDCVVIPCLGFSESGLRLGRGGGYYDATLPLMPRAFRVGVAFELQVVTELPREPHDAPLDAIVTDARTLLFHRGRQPSPRA